MHDRLCEFFADVCMPFKMCRPIRIDRLSCRFPRIVKQHCKTQHFICRNIHQRMDRMLTYIITVMQSFLRCFHHCIEFREDHLCDPKLICILDLFRMIGDQKLYKLCLDTFCTDIGKIWCKFSDCLSGLFLNLKSKLCRKTDRPQNPQGILRKTCLSISHTTDHTFFQILHPMKQIYQSVLFIVRHRIDRKIPAQQIL